MEGEQAQIVGKPTMLAKYPGLQDARAILDALSGVGYPLEDVSVLFRYEGEDQVIDLVTGHVAAGQSLTDDEIKKDKLEKQKGQTAVLLHPGPEHLEAVRQALSHLGEVEIEYAGETRAQGRPGGIERHDEQPT